MLLLALNELSRDDDDLLAVFHANDPQSRGCWLAVTSSCLIYIPNRPAVAAHNPDPLHFELKELQQIRANRRLTKSRFSFATSNAGQFTFSMKGTKDATELAEVIGKAKS